MKKYFFLFTVIIVSFASIFSLKWYGHEETSEFITLLKVIIPGIAFSIFIVAYQTPFFKIFKSLFLFIILVIIYFINFLIGMSSWGFAVPIAGGIGGALVNAALIYNHKEARKDLMQFIGYGMASSTIGLIFYFATQGYFNEGIGFGAIITIWQLIIGIEYIKFLNQLK